MSLITILIADDQRLVRSGLRTILSVVTDLRVVAEAANGQEALDTALAVHPDVILMDVQMPVLDGIKATEQVVTQLPNTRVLLLTTFDDDAYIFEGLRAGAGGYLLKDTEDEELVRAIRALAQGHVFLQPSIAQKVVAELNQAKRERPIQEPTFIELSAQDIDILKLVAEGKTNREVADTLHHTEGTIKQYMRVITGKLGAHSRAHAVSKAKDLGLI